MDKNGGVSSYSVENVLSHSAKTFVGEPFWMSLISGIEKFYAQEGYVTVFLRIFFSHSAETFRRGTSLCWVSEKV